MNNFAFSILLVLTGLLLGFVLVFVINYLRGKNASKKIDKMLETAKKDAEKIKKDYLLEGKEEIQKLKNETEKDLKEKKQELKDSEQRLFTRENNMDRRDETLQNREKMLDEKENNLINKQNDIQEEAVKVENLKKEQLALIEKISGLTKNEAKDLLMKQVESSISLELAAYIKDRESEAKLEADKKANSLLISCMQKYASEVSNEQTVTVVTLPNDEMKGRIIGREGRNIRTIEAVTGVDLIIDDTPEAIVLSSFDPLRREIARVTLENLIKDGRIHPTRIEEIYDKTASEMLMKITEYGEEALFKLGITKMDHELISLVGRLHFRTSSECNENVALAKRAGLLHDIGKAIDHEVEGSHVEIGSEIAKKYKENEVVINAIESHHGDTPATSIISSLVAIADTLSASRPGARNDSLENYVKRLQDLENIANSIDGIEKSFAVQAGRELRVIVKPEEIDDLQSHKIARDIKNRIENELQYPGTIKVTVVRETRAVEEAK